MVKEYMFYDAENMIDLARDIQSNVYWGGSFCIEDEEEKETVNWKYFWDVVVTAREVKGAIGVDIRVTGEVRFIYK